jgi:hypothetical protein
VARRTAARAQAAAAAAPAPAPAAQQVWAMYRQLAAGVAGDAEAQKALEQNRKEQPVVAWFSELAGGAGDLPDAAAFTAPQGLLDQAVALIKAGETAQAHAKLQEAERLWKPLHERVHGYREGAITGAGRSITGLEYTAAAGAVAATVATGGVASAAGAGLIVSAGVAGATAGTYGALQEEGGQVGEMIAGVRSAGNFDLERIWRRGSQDAVVGFAGALAGGALAKFLGRHAATFIRRLPPGQLEALGRAFGLSGPMPAAYLQKAAGLLVDFVSGVASAPVSTAVSATLKRLSGEREGVPDLDEFAAQVWQEMVQAGIMQLFVSAVTEGTGAAGMGTGFEQSVPSWAGKTPSAPAAPAPAATGGDAGSGSGGGTAGGGGNGGGESLFGPRDSWIGGDHVLEPHPGGHEHAPAFISGEGVAAEPGARAELFGPPRDPGRVTRVPPGPPPKEGYTAVPRGRPSDHDIDASRGRGRYVRNAYPRDRVQHHVIPQAEKIAKWAKASPRGLDVHDYCVGLSAAEHEATHALDFNPDWEAFIRDHADATRQETLDFAESLRKEHHLDHLPYERYGKPPPPEEE